MGVTVEPQSFTYVKFDAAQVQEIATALAAEVGLADADVEVVIDESVPLARLRLGSIDPVRLEVEGGALEDNKHPLQLSPRKTADALGRLLWQAADRRSAAFGEVPDDDELSAAHKTAWDTYCVARLARDGHVAQRQRRLYTFRLRHSFTDVSDAAFDAIWNGQDLTWAELTALSDDASAAKEPAA